MIRKMFFILVFISGVLLDARAQDDSVISPVPLLSLNLEDLDYPVDSSRLKMISAGRISKKLEDLPLQVYVITEDEILKNQYTTLTDVLLALPGIQISRPGTGELGESFQIWNLTGNLYTKILINGIPVKPSVVSGMPIGSQLPIRQAEKIEVIYGNSSAVYGADAVSGVINIVTKEAYRGNFVRGDISLGRNGHNYINFSVGGKGGKNNNILQYSFYGSKYELSDMNLDYAEEGLYNPMNFYQTTGKQITIGSETVRPADIDEAVLDASNIDEEEFKREYYGEKYEGSLNMPDMEALSSEAHMLGMQLKFKGFGLSYNYMYRRTHSSLGLSPVFYKYNNPQNFWGESIQQFSLEYRKVFRSFTSTTQLNSLAYSMDNNSSQGLTQVGFTDKVYRYSASNDIEFNQVFSASLFKAGQVVTGLEFSRSGNLPTTNYLLSPFEKSIYTPFATSIDSSDYPATPTGRFGFNPIVFSNISGFLQFSYDWKKFRFLGGLRYDINTLYGDRTSPHLAILHKTSRRTSIRLSVGTAYKAPPTSLTYQSLAYPVDTQLFVVAHPNVGLRPERFTTLELGFTTNFSPRFTLQQTFFSYRITNHIIPLQLPARYFNVENVINDSIGFWANYAESVSTVGGSQTTLRFTNLVRAIKLNAEVHLYFQARQDQLPNVIDIVEDYITLSPRHSGKLKVSMQPTENFYLYVESHWMSKWLRILIPFEDLYEGIFGAADGYYSMNAVASYNLSQQLNIFVKATNIFDEKYGAVNPTLLEQGLIYNPQLRRTLRFGLSYRFN